jgi:choline transport protein
LIRTDFSKIFSWIGLCAAVPFVSALCLQGLIILNDETYIPQRWQATLLMWAFLSLPVLGNVYGRKLLKAVEIMGGVLHIVFFVVTITTLAVMSRRSTAKFVFTESFFGQSGWESEGVQWCIGLLSITSVLTGAATSNKL